MKKYFLPALLMTTVMLVVCVGIYSMILLGVAQVAPNSGKGKQIADKNGNTYFENIGQRFDQDIYFHSRPSAVDYDASGSGGSNKGPNETEYLKKVRERTDRFKMQNLNSSVQVDMVTASGSGLDPHISVKSAYAQVSRIAISRGIDPEIVKNIVKRYEEKNMIGPEKVNVLKLNIALDSIGSK